MQYLQIRETPDGEYAVEAYEDAMPPRFVAAYRTLDEALDSANVDWEEFVAEDDGDAGDVLYIARVDRIEDASRDVYLCLARTAHGRPYWLTSCDCQASVPPDELVMVRGPATVGPAGYESEAEAAEALADGSLDPSGVDIILNDDGTWFIEDEDPS